jgi:hypothetical protein
MVTAQAQKKKQTAQNTKNWRNKSVLFQQKNDVGLSINQEKEITSQRNCEPHKTNRK